MTSKTLRLLILIAAISFAVEAFAQRSAVYLDNGFRRTKEELAYYTMEVTSFSVGNFRGSVVVNSHIKMQGEYLQTESGFIEHGQFKFYYPNGQVESEGMYDRGVRVGTWKRYTFDGSSKPDRYYNPEGASNLRKALGIAAG